MTSHADGLPITRFLPSVATYGRSPNRVERPLYLIAWERIILQPSGSRDRRPAEGQRPGRILLWHLCASRVKLTVRNTRTKLEGGFQYKSTTVSNIVPDTYIPGVENGVLSAIQLVH